MRMMLLALTLMAAPARAEWRDEVIYRVETPPLGESVEAEVDALKAGFARIADLGFSVVWVALPTDTGDVRLLALPLDDIVTAAKASGLKVVIDADMGGADKLKDWESAHPDWFLPKPECTATPETPCPEVAAQLDFTKGEVKDALVAEVIALAKASKIDGLALTAPTEMAPEVASELQGRISQDLGESIMVVNGRLDEAFGPAVLDWIDGKSTTKSFAALLAQRSADAEAPLLAPVLVADSAELSARLLALDDEKTLLALTLLLSAAGPPVLSDGEAAWLFPQPPPGPEEAQETPVAEPAHDEDLLAAVAELLEIRAAFREARASETDVLWTTKDALVIARGNDIVVALNRGSTDLKPDSGWTLQFASDDLGETILPAHSARIYSREGP